MHVAQAGGRGVVWRVQEAQEGCNLPQAAASKRGGQGHRLLFISEHTGDGRQRQLGRQRQDGWKLHSLAGHVAAWRDRASTRAAYTPEQQFSACLEDPNPKQLTPNLGVPMADANPAAAPHLVAAGWLSVLRLRHKHLAQHCGSSRQHLGMQRQAHAAHKRIAAAGEGAGRWQYLWMRCRQAANATT